MHGKRTTPRHIIIKMPKVKDKERILKAAREKQLVTYRGVPIRLSADFSKETLQARRDWQEIFKVMKSRDLQLRLFYPAKLSFRLEGQIKSSQKRKKLKELIITKPLLHEMLKKIQSEMKGSLLELKYSLQKNNSRVDDTENQINDLEHKEAKTNQ